MNMEADLCPVVGFGTCGTLLGSVPLICCLWFGLGSPGLLCSCSYIAVGGAGTALVNNCF